MKRIPEISVVMGVYNGEKELAEAVESILAQCDADFEFIIVNDGSTDCSADMLDAFAARDSRVRVIHQQNTGLTRALVRGCSEARGEFIARQDSDDISLPGRLSLQAAMLRQNPELGFVSSWAEWVGPEGELLFVNKRVDEPGPATQKLLYEKQGPAAHGSVMLRKSSYEASGGYREAFYFAQDIDLWMRLGHIGQLGYVQKSLYRFKVSFSSISGSKGALQAEYDRLAHACHNARLKDEDETPFLREASQLRTNGKFPTSPKSDASTAYFIGRCLLAKGDSRARKYLQMAVRNHPWHVRAWASLLKAVVWPTHAEEK
ncbi:MAG: hypothetical protein COW18_04515 [Zetaproteobacteria bacterium CG12_big_fil_rev_8_21_14_0_65_54_13]|nr:MAG: hypothetical protein COX55_11025 [Zetaproteobacteria bacterium CG23_combo_of_CG06-09_8_20_14_all_54_7]PIW49969.1 MAG: hypothetical protein COW18_04515 [Zetaproteobacteria bacterium CG12_big_fil_rev_8_21_14_0_65_54_13]PIX54986.1 MAG: hypothetical protein COZ50_05115 [Zetaproteobacteria bacterium CG_4_10_14_3_um_filter_54_28]